MFLFCVILCTFILTFCSPLSAILDPQCLSVTPAFNYVCAFKPCLSTTSLPGIGNEQEYVIFRQTSEGEFIIIKYYNPCRKLDLSRLMPIEGLDGKWVIVCGDFNMHCTLWGAIKTDTNGEVIEELLE